MTEDHSDRRGVVQDVSLEFEGRAVKAVYFLEAGIITVRVDEKIYRIPQSEHAAADSVRSLLESLYAELG